MNVLYHLTVLPPQMPKAEALSQEIEALRRVYGGDLLYLNPNRQAIGPIPRIFFGFHRLLEIRRLEARIHLHHFYNPDPFAFPILRFLRRPIVYTITSGLAPDQPIPALFRNISWATVPDERSLAALRMAGVVNSSVVRAGIDTSRFTHAPQPVGEGIRLLMGSAPWTESQFHSKGVDALLAAASQEPRLHLVFLWRGVLTESMRERVRGFGLEQQVTVLDQLVDVNRILADVHAAIALADGPGIVKSYPHSLLDALAAGKPVLVSRAIPMADYVVETGCGEVVEAVTPEAILASVERLLADYPACMAMAQAVGRRDFAEAGMVEGYGEIYRTLAGGD